MYVFQPSFRFAYHCWWLGPNFSDVRDEKLPVLYLPTHYYQRFLGAPSGVKQKKFLSFHDCQEKKSDPDFLLESFSLVFFPWNCCCCCHHYLFFDRLVFTNRQLGSDFFSSSSSEGGYRVVGKYWCFFF